MQRSPMNRRFHGCFTCMFVSLFIFFTSLGLLYGEDAPVVSYGIVEQYTNFTLNQTAGYDQLTAVDVNSGPIRSDSPGTGVQIATWSLKGSSSTGLDLYVSYDTLSAKIGNLVYKIPYMLYNGESAVPSESSLYELVRSGNVYYQDDNNGVMSIKRTTRATYPSDAQYSTKITLCFKTH